MAHTFNSWQISEFKASIAWSTEIQETKATEKPCLKKPNWWDPLQSYRRQGCFGEGKKLNCQPSSKKKQHVEVPNNWLETGLRVQVKGEHPAQR